MRLLLELYLNSNSYAVYEKTSFLALKLIYWCCNDEALGADDNAIKTVNLCQILFRQLFQHHKCFARLRWPLTGDTCQ